MGLYVEVRCDYQTETKLNDGCRTVHGMHNPDGGREKEATASAQRQGWKKLSKGWCCPPCLEFIS